MSNTSGGPIATLKDHYIKAAIWKNESDKGAFYSATIERTYKQGDEYKSSQSFSGRDVLAAGQLLLRAYEQILEQEQADFAASQPKPEC
ncbi:hypothetical protein [Adhaeretor mobilis]|uniref:Uncharacterized protein n=1 Tax=Adhaeretor mobilis TaxID=1930276 RepID=A0A517MWR2_9BACT|nr:hypothetical protein [Adhaeretor mobilis]QDS99316.1 hypothetical protein HG15A2_26380 [Adhaeretor mobilis]